jgi:hypothetical protein
MFCPKCGIEDSTQDHFCRSCGTSLRTVRSALEQPDALTTAAVSAREEIGRAIANKISEFEGIHELRQAVYELLPAIQEFLESPEERLLRKREQRMNKMREGALTAFGGLAIILASLLVGWLTRKEEILIVTALGLFVFLIGLGIAITASWFTDSSKPRRSSLEVTTRFKSAEGSNPPLIKDTTKPHSHFRSVTEGTTREL